MEAFVHFMSYDESTFMMTKQRMKPLGIFVKMPMAAIIVTQFLKPKVINFLMDKFAYLQQQSDF